MKILYITMDPLENNSSANIRNRGLITGLKMKGHKVDTLSLGLNKNSVNFDNSIIDLDCLVDKRYFIKANYFYNKLRTNKKNVDEKETLNNKFSFNKKFRKRLKDTIKTILEKICIYDVQKINVKNVKNVPINIETYNLIISSSDPKSAHLIAKEILKSSKKKIRWIQYWGDPMYDDITTKKGAVKSCLLKFTERQLLKKADGVVYTSPFTLEKQRKLFKGQRYKMTYTVQACIPIHEKEKKRNNKIMLGYFGDYNEAIRNICPLYHAVHALGVNLMVCGSGSPKIESKNIQYIEKVSYGEAKKLESSVDILVCVCNKNGTQIPGKIYYESAYSKPFIIIVDGNNKNRMKRYFEQFHRYIICENTKDDIRKAIRKAIDEIDQKKKYQIPNKMKAQVVAQAVLKLGVL